MNIHRSNPVSMIPSIACLWHSSASFGFRCSSSTSSWWWENKCRCSAAARDSILDGKLFFPRSGCSSCVPSSRAALPVESVSVWWDFHWEAERRGGKKIAKSRKSNISHLELYVSFTFHCCCFGPRSCRSINFNLSTNWMNVFSAETAQKRRAERKAKINFRYRLTNSPFSVVCFVYGHWTAAKRSDGKKINIFLSVFLREFTDTFSSSCHSIAGCLETLHQRAHANSMFNYPLQHSEQGKGVFPLLLLLCDINDHSGDITRCVVPLENLVQFHNYH